MRLASTRIITEDVAALADFYHQVTGIEPRWATDQFVEFVTPTATLAIGGTATVALFAPGSAHPADNHSMIVEFLVDDVDAAYEQLHGPDLTVVAEPATLPWGNRSLLLRDPDGNLVNLFTPLTADAKSRVDR